MAWPLVGREQELSAFAESLASRPGRGFVIAGPPGVGKTHLAEECLRRAARAGFRTRRATASAAASAVPLSALADLLPPGVDLSQPVTSFAAVAAAMAAPPRHRWAVLVDDLHLLDAASVMLLRELMDAGLIRLIATLRSGEPTKAAVHALTHGDSVDRVELTAFDQCQLEAVLQAALGGPVARHTAQVLYHASSGNALFLRELVHAAHADQVLAFDGVWRLAPGRLPRTSRLTELIRTRLTAAGQAGRPVLELLAACGPLPLPDVEAAAPSLVLVDLEHAGLIRISQDHRRTTVALAHPLYGEVLRDITPVRRQRTALLEQAVRAEATGARRRGDPLQIASWRLAASHTADPTLICQAATLARAAHDYEQAVSLLDALPESRRNVQTRILLGETLSQMGRWHQAEAVLSEADTCTGHDEAGLAITLARTGNLAWSNAALDEALAVNDSATSRATAAADRQALRLNEGFLRIVAGQPGRGLALLDDLETAPSGSLDLKAWLRGALVKPIALALTGRTSAAAAWAERAFASHQQLDDHLLVCHPIIQRIPLVLALTEAGHLAAATTTGEGAYNEITNSCPVAQVWMAILLARAQWIAGHPSISRRWYAEATVLARTLNHTKALRPSLAGLAACSALLGDRATAEASLAEHAALPSVAPCFLPAAEESLGRAWLLASCGHQGKARTVLAQAAAQARSTGNPTTEALLLTDLARLGGAKDVSNRMAILAQQCDGELASARARLVAALAESDPGRLQDVAAELDGLGADLLATEAATTAAHAWARAGHTRRATSAACQASQTASRCQDAHTPMLAAAQTATALTSREREIALVAAKGRASKDIAEALHLSVRTVENHLQHAYTKLGVTTRHELARALNPA